MSFKLLNVSLIKVVSESVVFKTILIFIHRGFKNKHVRTYCDDRYPFIHRNIQVSVPKKTFVQICYNLCGKVFYKYISIYVFI